MNKLNPQPSGSRRHDELESLGGQSGVYVIWKKLYAYIGSTSDLRARLRKHSVKFAGWEYVYQRLPIAQARQREGELIRKFAAKGFRILNQRHVAAVLQRAPGVSRQLAHARIKAGWDPVRARMTPPRRYK